MAETSAHYTVLARRYRPQTFSDVVGQQHVAQALKNAILADRVAHAYLFTGARGVGKTSMARILAKALNCPNASEGDPCNECDMCLAISSGSDVDVLEIDGASNRGIDDIRALRANVGVRSMRTRIKLYIIDEVHMLTKEAFNALLKTLEEPPPNVKFVFCTTEPHKVPDTILSRCQRFDFSSIETQAIAERLDDIARQEGVEVAADAIDLVARRAGGSMRDSQSLFDQLLAFGGKTISAADVNQLLGTADDDRLLAILKAVSDSDRASVLTLIDQSVQAGVQLGNLIDQLVNLFRDLMIVGQQADEVTLIGIGPNNRQALQEMSQSWSLEKTIASMQILSDTKQRLARVPHTRALVDLAVIRLTTMEDLVAIPELISRMEQGGAGLSVAPASSAPGRPIEKKNVEVQPTSPLIETPVNDPQPEAIPASIPQIEEPEVRLEFTENSSDAIWKRLLETVDSTIKTQLSLASRAVVKPPNRLLVEYSPKYAFSHDYFLQKPDHARKAEGYLQKIVGPGHVLEFRIDNSGESVKNEDPVPAVEMKSVQKHDFVELAETIFSAKVARTDRIRKTE